MRDYLSAATPSTSYTKPHLTYEQQLTKIRANGLHVADEDRALRALKQFGYYRLSGYWYDWRSHPSDQRHTSRLSTFEPGHSFDDLIAIYEFDRHLRPLLFAGIESLELSLRAQMAYELGAIDPWLHLKREYLNDLADRAIGDQGEAQFDLLQRRVCELMDRSKENFASHFRSRYDGQPPLWIAVETWDLGLLATLFELLRDPLQLQIARPYGVSHRSTFISWLKALNQLRNICAHHGRLFKRKVKPEPGTAAMKRMPELAHVPGLPPIRKEKLYPTLVALTFLHQQVDPYSGWRVRVRDYFSAFPNVHGGSLADYGFPDYWLEQDLWLACEPDSEPAPHSPIGGM